MKKLLLGVVAAIALVVPFAAQKADAQVRVVVGGRRHPVRHYHRPVHRGYRR